MALIIFFNKQIINLTLCYFIIYTKITQRPSQFLPFLNSWVFIFLVSRLVGASSQSYGIFMVIIK